jgi:hypothetical protein
MFLTARESIYSTFTLLSSTISAELLMNTGKLSISKFVHATVVHVVHEVGIGVVARIVGARVDDTGASVVGLLLSRGVGNTITTSNLVASTLEGVVETHPMANFMSSSVTFIVLERGQRIRIRPEKRKIV